VEDAEGPRPIYVVWELTMKCDQPCQHCGSRAGQRFEIVEEPIP
jgi:MoaA/NifB/PqqE/SkfB family radical SAM enzyme